MDRLFSITKTLMTASVLATLAVGCGGDPADSSANGNDTGEPPDSIWSNLVTDIFTGDEGDPSGPEVDVVVEPGTMGWPCEDNADCHSGYCIPTADGKMCTTICDESCPAGWNCDQLAGAGDPVYICVPTWLHLCDPCMESSDCQDSAGATGHYCLDWGAEGHFCGGDCSVDGLCPDGYECAEKEIPGGGVASQCVPTNGQCGCSPLAIELQLSTQCAQENDEGSCEGVRACGPEGLGPCDAPEPIAEICDGLDNNCNGQVDEAFDLSGVGCDGDDDDSCEDGQWICNGQMLFCDDDPTSVPEVCDGVDNDCDGDTDESLCDDLNPCTDDQCLPEGGCIHSNNVLPCDDGSTCTGIDLCQEGVCVGYNPILCGDGDDCTDDICDPTVGCLYSHNTAPCEDGEICTEDDACKNGSCESGLWKNCNDDNQCTSDECISGMGCDYEPNSFPCVTGSSSCPDGICGGGLCQVDTSKGCIAEVDVGLGGLCTAEMPGTCGGNGQCVPTGGSPGCTCGPCDSFCACCLGFSLCLDFLFDD